MAWEEILGGVTLTAEVDCWRDGTVTIWLRAGFEDAGGHRKSERPEGFSGAPLEGCAWLAAAATAAIHRAMSPDG